MSEVPPDPPQRPEPLAYRTPQASPVGGRAFGNIWGNMAMGVAAIICSMVLAAKLSRTIPPLILPIATLSLGVAAAMIPRYRGVLFGMLLIVVGVPLLILGLCMMQ